MTNQDKSALLNIAKYMCIRVLCWDRKADDSRKIWSFMNKPNDRIIKNLFLPGLEPPQTHTVLTEMVFQAWGALVTRTLFPSVTTIDGLYNPSTIRWWTVDYSVILSIRLNEFQIFFWLMSQAK